MATQRGQEPEGRIEREGSSVGSGAGHEPETTRVCGAGETESEGGGSSPFFLRPHVRYARSDEGQQGSSDS